MGERDHYFTDAKGREWELAITVGVIKKTKLKLAVNLVDAMEYSKGGESKRDVLSQLADDPVLFIDVLFCICEEQAKERRVSEVEFGELFCTGEIMESAMKAFLNGLLRFLPPSRRLAMEKILQIANRNLEKMQEEARRALEAPEVIEEIDKAWKAEFDKALKIQSSSTPES